MNDFSVEKADYLWEEMKCPLCEKVLTKNSNEFRTIYECLQHFYFDVSDECFGFRLIVKNYKFVGYNTSGYLNFNYMVISSPTKELIRTSWIPVKSPQDVLNLFNKLMKLKAFI